jgi:hypothetical protein
LDNESRLAPKIGRKHIRRRPNFFFRRIFGRPNLFFGGFSAGPNFSAAAAKFGG